MLTKHSQQRKTPNGDVKYFKEKTLQLLMQKNYCTLHLKKNCVMPYVYNREFFI